MNIQNVFKKARENGYAIPQFNMSDLAQVNALRDVLKKKPDIPVILGTSQGEASYISVDIAVAIKKSLQKQFPQSTILLNLDHSKSFDAIKEAIEVGYPMVHFDGSALPFEENVQETIKIAKYCHKKRIFIEGEVGSLEGESKLHPGITPKVDEAGLTNPEMAADFVKKTNVDSLAVAIGNIHGIYTAKPNLDLDRFLNIKNLIGQKSFLVLHGGSEIVEDQIKKAIAIGIQKININTELRAAWRAGLEEAFKNNPQEVAPYKNAQISIVKIGAIMEQKLKMFNLW